METSAIKTNIKEKKLSVFENFLHHISKNSNPFSVSHAICLGLLLGFMPKNNLLWYVLVVLFLFIRLNPFYYLISIIIGTLASPLLDNIFDSIGYKILTLPVLENFFSSLLDIPFVFFTRINNSIVAGSIVFSVICYVPIFFLVMIIKKLIDKFLAKKSEDGRKNFENAQTVNVQVSNEQVVNKEVVNNIQVQNSMEHTLSMNQSNQSKKKKFFIRIVPLASVLCVILIFVLGVYLFKNLIAKRVIVSALQSIFQAKTDIEQTNLDLRNAKLSVKNLEQANKYNVMKNIFQIDSIVFDLNLRELARGKFDAENVAFENVKFGTERKSSGYIPSIKSKEEQENEIFILNMQQNIASDVQKLLTETFSDYNPEHIITRVQTDLASPVVAESAKKIIEELIQKWKDSPENMQEKILAFSKSVEGLVATDWENIRDVSVLQKALKDTNDAITRGKSIKNETENIVSEFRKDTSQLAELSRNVANAIRSDRLRIETEINKFKYFKSGGIEGIFNKTINAFMYNFFGSYYPQVQRVLDSIRSISLNKDEKPRTEKKSFRKEGRYVHYKKDRVPKILIENAKGSGEGWSVFAKEISSDPDVRGLPGELGASFNIKNISNKISAVVDGRTSSSNYFISADYLGSGFPIALNINDNFLLNSDFANIACGISASPNGSFSLRGSVDMSSLKIKNAEFAPEVIYSIYQKAIERFTQLKVGFDFGYNAVDKKLSLNIDTDAGKQFANIFQNILQAEINNVVSVARKTAEELLAEKTSAYSEAFEKISSIQNLIMTNQSNFANKSEQLENLRAKITKQISEKASGTVQQKASDALKGLFTR